MFVFGLRERVAVVVRPVDVLLLALRALLLPVLAAVVSLRALQLLAETLNVEASNWALAAVVLASGLTYVFVIQTPAISQRVDRAFAGVRRRTVLACNHAVGAKHGRSGISCLLTPDHLRAPTFRYDQQVDVVAALSEACEGDPDTSFWFVEGASGSGKSRTAYMLVDRLIRDPELFELTNRTYLYDLAMGRRVQSDLRSRLGTARHENAVILVDNFQRVGSETIRDLTRRLVDGTAGSSERIFIFLARPTESWNLSPGSDVRLLSEAKRRGRHFTLSGANEAPLVAEVSRIDLAASELVRDLEGRGVASAAQLQVAQIVARHGVAPPSVAAMLRLLTGRIDVLDPPRRTASMLGMIAALAMHRGAFSRSEFLRSTVHATQGQSIVRRTTDALWFTRELRRLRRAGFLPTAYLGRRQYLFHESFAELCIDRLHDCEPFFTPFAKVGAMRVDETADTDESTRWLLATEIGDSSSMVRLFDGALLSGAYNQMSRCVERARDRSDLRIEIQLQLGILLNRVGEFTSSKKVMSSLGNGLSHAPDLEVQMITSAVEARHDEEASDAIVLLQRHDDPFVRSAGNYWRYHVDAHRGTFAAPALRSMADAQVESALAADSYWALYQVARMHFDSMRHEYLSGSATASSIGAALDSVASQQLSEHLPTYEALTSLYGRAHLVGHVLVPDLAIFRSPARYEDVAFIGLQSKSLGDLAMLLDQMVQLYSATRDEFWQYGDREARFLQADVLNAWLVQDNADFDEVEFRIHEYSRFLLEADYADLASYPSLYFFRLHMLRYFAAILEGTTSALDRAGEHLREASMSLAKIREMDHACNNRYGLFRCEVFEALHDSVSRGVDLPRFHRILENARRGGYGFEHRLAAHIIDRERLTGAELRQILRFYPIVHQ